MQIKFLCHEKINLAITLSGFSDLQYNQILSSCFSSLSGKSRAHRFYLLRECTFRKSTIQPVIYQAISSICTKYASHYRQKTKLGACISVCSHLIYKLLLKRTILHHFFPPNSSPISKIEKLI